MKKHILTVAAYVALQFGLSGINTAQAQYTYTMANQTWTGFNFTQLPAGLTGTLTSVSVNVTLNASVAYTYADDICVYVAGNPLALGGFFQAGGFSNLNAAERQSWPNGGSDAPGTTCVGIITLNTPIVFTGASSDPVIWIGNGYGAAGTSGTWTGSATLNGISLGATCTAPTLSATTVAALCAGNANGSIDLTTTGGSPTPLIYAWSNGGSAEDLSGLTAGTYSVTVTTQTGGCSATGSYTVAEGAPNVTYYADADGDTYGDASSSVQACTLPIPAGYVSNSTDCDDGNAAVNLGATEVCNSIDDNCDTQIDEGVQTIYYADTDGDGYGVNSSNTTGTITTQDYGNGEYIFDMSYVDIVFPSVINGLTSFTVSVQNTAATSTNWFYFHDASGNNIASVEFQPIDGGYINVTYTFPTPLDGVTSVGVYSWWNPIILHDVTFTYIDVSTQLACTAPAGYVADNTDCDDNNAAVNPVGVDICGNGIDEDCSGSDCPIPGCTDANACNYDASATTDDGSCLIASLEYFYDNDGDGYGDPLSGSLFCTPQDAPWSLTNTDCDDFDNAINPAATEICNGMDDNCNGTADDGLVFEEYFVDVDADGYGVPTSNYVISPLAFELLTPDVAPANAGPSCDDCTTQIPIGFTFPFYENTYTNLEISSNGFVSFDLIDESGCCDGEIIPSLDYVNNIIALGWYDLAPENGEITYFNLSNPNRLVIEYSNAPEFDDSGVLSGQIVLFESGEIQLIYSNLSAADHIITAGVENANGTIAAAIPGFNSQVNSLSNVAYQFVNTTLSAVPSLNYAISPLSFELLTPAVAPANAGPSCDDCTTQIPIGFTFPFYENTYTNLEISSNGFVSFDLINESGCCDGEIIPSLDYVNNIIALGWYDLAPENGEITYFNLSNPNRLVIEYSNAPEFDDSGVLSGQIVLFESGEIQLIYSNLSAADHIITAGVENANGTLAAAIPGFNSQVNSISNVAYQFVYTTLSAVPGISSCSVLAGYALNNTDCNDNNAAVNSGATEICNSIDDNCDTQIDEGVQSTFYADVDGDTYGDASSSVQGCTASVGYVSNSTDCNDANAAVNPGATEVCNGTDDDCSGVADDGLTFTDYYADLDLDGYGAGAATNACAQPTGFVTTNTDCDDNNAAVNPGATEVCNGTDDDCSGVADDGLTFTDYYSDIDLDGYGAGAATNACAQPTGFVTTNTDCDDNNAAVNPGATEVCNSIDDNCDTQIDEGVQSTFYADVDGDTYGNASSSVQGCTASVGYVSNSTDCNDANAAVNPGAAEVCNGIDDDCDGSIEIQPAMPTSQPIPNTNYYNLSAFTTAAVNAGYTISATETFDNLNGFYAGPLSGNFGAGTPTWTASATGGLFCGAAGGSNTLSTNNPVPLTLTFNPGVTGLGANIFITDASFNVIPGTITATFSNGATASFSTTSATDFFGATSNSTLITSISISATNTTVNGYVTVDNLVIATGTLNPSSNVSQSDLSNFTTAAVTAGYTISTTETFDNLNGFYAGPLSGNFGAGTPTWTASATGGLFCGAAGGSNTLSTNNPVPLTLTFNPGVTGLGANIFITDASFNVIPGTITATFSNGNTNSFSTTSASDFFSATAYSTLITSISISSTSATTGYVTVDNLVIATGTINPTLACYQSYVYNSNTCSWEVTGTQPSQPTLACYETATFNTTSCVWDVTATGGSATYYADMDVDGFGDASASIQGYTCSGAPAGYVTDATDCNDNNAAVNSGATEICNSIDDNCDTQIDEGLIFTNYYADVDGDSFGAGTAVNACAQSVGYVLTNTDCNDNNAAVNPTATESCSTAFDDNCNGIVNEGCSAIAGDNPSNATSMTTSIWPNCNAINGTLVNATASGSAQTVCLTGEDKWHQFVATSEGISIVVNSSAADIVIELQTAAGVLVAQENAVDGLGGETLNHYGLTAGQVYKIGVRNYNSALGTGTYSICAKMLKRGGCDYGPGPYTLCQYFKATWAGATGTSYTYTFTGISGPASGNVYTRTQNSDICVLSSVLPTLPYGSTYNVLISNTYTINNGAGVAEVITVPGLAPCSMSTAAQPVTALRTSNQCAAGPRFRGAIVASLPWVCGATNWRWEFTELDAQSQPVGLPISVNRGAASNYINLGTVLQLQYGKTYSVRTAPILPYTGTDYQWGAPVCMSIVGSAGMIADGSQAANQAVRVETANEVNMSLYPNPTHGTDVNINLSGVTSENVQIRVVDAMGRQVWSNRYSVDGILNTNITFERPLANGLYFVEAIYNGELQTQRMMVQK